MEDDVDRKMGREALGLLRRAPGSAKEPVHVGPDLRGRVIETKKRVKTSALKLPLPHHTSATSFIGFVSGAREKSLYVFWVMRILIGLDLSLWMHMRPNPLKQPLSGFRSLIRAWAILLSRNLSKNTFGWHL